MENNFIDFLTPEGAEPTEFETKESVIVDENKSHIDPTKPKEEAKQPDDKPAEKSGKSGDQKELTSTIDFIGNSEEGDDNSDTPNDQGTNEQDYLDVFMDLAKNGYIDVDNLPDTVNTDEDSPTTAEDVLNAVLHNLPKREEALLKYGQDSLINQLPKQLQDAIAYAGNQGDPIEYLKTMIGSQEITSLDPEVESDQVTIVREFYKTTDLTPEEINEKIEDLKDTGLIAKEASKLKPKLDKRAEDVAQKKLESQANIKSQKDNATKAASTRVTNTLLKGVDGIKFKREEAEDMLDALMVEQEFNYGTHSATKTGIEYLIDFHKYSTTGNPERVIKALMILDPKGRYDEKLASLYKKDIQTQFVNDHMTNSKNKFRQPAKTEPTNTKAQPNKGSGKFKFI